MEKLMEIILGKPNIKFHKEKIKIFKKYTPENVG